MDTTGTSVLRVIAAREQIRYLVLKLELLPLTKSMSVDQRYTETVAGYKDLVEAARELVFAEEQLAEETRQYRLNHGGSVH